MSNDIIKRVIAADKAVLSSSTSLPAMTRQHYSGPTPNIRVLLIDGADRSIKQIIMRMHPDEFRKVLGPREVKWAKLGEIDERVHIMLAGDDTEQTVATSHRWFEQEFEVTAADGTVGPVLHGRAVVFGFAPALKKAASSPVNPIWLEERVRWLEPGRIRPLSPPDLAKLQGFDLEKTESATALENEPRQEGEAEEPRQAGLPALPPAGSLDR